MKNGIFLFLLTAAVVAFSLIDGADAEEAGFKACPYKSKVVDGCTDSSVLTGSISDGNGGAGNIFKVTDIKKGKVGLGQLLNIDGIQSYTFITSPVRVNTAITTTKGKTTFTVVEGSNLYPGMLVKSAQISDGASISSISGNAGTLSSPAKENGTDPTSSFLPLGSLGSYYVSENNNLRGEFKATTLPPKLPEMSTVVGDNAYATPATLQFPSYLKDDCSYYAPDGFRTKVRITADGTTALVTVGGLSGYPITADTTLGSILDSPSGKVRLTKQVSGTPGGNGIYETAAVIHGQKNGPVSAGAIIVHPEAQLAHPAPIGCARQTGQPYSDAWRLHSNMAGVEYPVGVNWDELYADTGSRALRDPAEIAKYVSGCAYVGSPRFAVNCSSNGDLVIEGFDWSRNGGTSLLIGKITGKFVFKNNYVWYDTNTAAYQSNGGQFMKIGGIITGSCYYLNNVFNGNPPGWKQPNATAFIFIATGNTCQGPGGGTMAYNAMFWLPGRITSGSNLGVYRFFNYISGLDNVYSSTHAELDYIGGFVGQTELPPFVFAYNTINGTAEDAAAGMGGYNALMVPFVSSEAPRFIGTIDDGAGTGAAGDVLTVTNCPSICIYVGTSIADGSILDGTGTRVDPSPNPMCGPSTCTGTGGDGTYHLLLPKLGKALVRAKPMFGSRSGAMPDNVLLLGNTIATNRRNGMSTTPDTGTNVNDIFSMQATYLPHLTIIGNAFGPADVAAGRVIGSRSRGYIEPAGALIFGNFSLYDGSPCNTLNGPCYGTYPKFPQAR